MYKYYMYVFYLCKNIVYNKMFLRFICINIKFKYFKFYVNKDFEKFFFCKGVNIFFYEKVKNEE